MSKTTILKGHGNEADFLGLLRKLVPHRSLTLPFEPFRFWLRIRGDIRNRKMTPTRRTGESMTRRLGESGSRLLNVKRKLGESESRRLPDSVSEGSRRLPDSASRGVTMESLFEFFKIFHQITAL